MAQKEIADKWRELGGQEWADEKNGRHRLYFNGLALRKLYGLYVEGETPLTATEEEKYKILYKIDYLPALPETATLKGKPLEPGEAFKLLLSKPYFDLDTGRFMNLAADISWHCTNGNPLLAKSLSAGGHEWLSEDKHRVYFNGNALKTLYGLATEGERIISEEGIARYKAEYHAKYLPPYPETAALNGKAIDAKEAFELLLSRPYLDVNAGTFVGLRAPLSKQMEFTAADQLKAMMAQAAVQDRLPWNRELTGTDTVEVPFNPVSGEQLRGNNLIAAVLHMEAIGSKDPRYVRESDLNAVTLKSGCIPLKVCYRTKDGTNEYGLKTETLYNAAQVTGAPEYQPVTAMNRHEVVAAAQGRNADEQMAHNMAAFIAALESGKGHKPIAVEPEGLDSIKIQPVDRFFSLLQKAHAESKDLINGTKAPDNETVQRQNAGMEM